MSITSRSSPAETKNKFRSQRIHKHFKNRHRSRTEKVYRDPQPTVFDSTDIDRVLRECHGRSTRELIGSSHEYDLVREDYFEDEEPCNLTWTSDTSSEDTDSDEKDRDDFLGMMDFEWACECCTFINWPDAMKCEMCDEPCWKFALVVVATEAKNSPFNHKAPEPIEQTSTVARSQQSVSFVMVDYLTPVRERASKAERVQEQTEKEAAAQAAKGKRWYRYKNGRQKPKVIPLPKEYPEKVIKMLPTREELSTMTNYKLEDVRPLNLPPRLAPSVRDILMRKRKVLGIAFHGTDERNTGSIVDNGLLVGGVETRRINGAACGVGVYCGKSADVARGYSRGKTNPIFVCLVLNGANDLGGIYVVPRSTQILPIYLLSKGIYSGPRMDNSVRSSSGGTRAAPISSMISIMNPKKKRVYTGLQIASNTRSAVPYDLFMSVKGRFSGRINLRDVTRKSRRKWPAR